MKLNYDKKTDSLYLELRKGEYKRSKKVSDSVLVDYDDTDKVLGIEVLGVKDVIPSFAPAKTKISHESRFASV